MALNITVNNTETTFHQLNFDYMIRGTFTIYLYAPNEVTIQSVKGLGSEQRIQT